jgi:hypothetical protein
LGLVVVVTAGIWIVGIIGIVVRRPVVGPVTFLINRPSIIGAAGIIAGTVGGIGIARGATGQGKGQEEREEKF